MIALFLSLQWDSWKIQMPAALTFNLKDDRYNWAYKSVLSGACRATLLPFASVLVFFQCFDQYTSCSNVMEVPPPLRVLHGNCFR